MILVWSYSEVHKEEETPTEDLRVTVDGWKRTSWKFQVAMPDAIDPCTLHHRVFPDLPLTTIVDRKNVWIILTTPRDMVLSLWVLTTLAWLMFWRTEYRSKYRPCSRERASCSSCHFHSSSNCCLTILLLRKYQNRSDIMIEGRR